MAKEPTLGRLQEIKAIVAEFVRQTPLWRSETFSRMVGCDVYLKAELFQKTGSYKPRGMYWALHELTAKQKECGVLTFSAGNAAQGLAYAGKLLDVPCTVIMPENASQSKVDATRDYGAEVVLHGTVQECLTYAHSLSKERDLTFISSYDDQNLMLGHSGLGLEILEQKPDVTAIFVGIGGGGMAGGLALSMNASNAKTKLFGVEPTGAPAMYESLRQGAPVQLTSVSTIADGLAAPSAGKHGYRLVRDRFEKVLLVDDAEIVESLKLLFSRAKLFAEPAGAAALAGLLSVSGTFSASDKVVCVVSGGNLDFDRMKTFI